ncbi:MAG: metallophosphoesterase family protein [Flavisolibacter sp.]
MKPKLWLLMLLLVTFSLSCKKEIGTKTGDGSSASTDVLRINDPLNPSGQLKIAVVSDIHYLAPSLITNNGAAGEAFQTYLNSDPKLLHLSDPIFKSVLAKLDVEKPDILLVPGDLTKDGERTSHEAVVSYLNEVTQLGTKIYVIPGNHDINNAKAMRYDGDASYPVATIQATDFASLYANFGYANAVERDSHSLSYLTQPYKGLWILAIDASRYEEYGPEGDIWAGRIKPETLQWALAKLAQAKDQNITVLGMMHHNLVEHYSGQSQMDPGYVIDDWQNVANQLADAGLKIIFTGHYHANDITPYVHNGNEVFDIETGSLVTPPSPFRIVMMKNKNLDISTYTVTSISAPIPGNMSFTDYSQVFLSQHLDGYFNYVLTNPPFEAPQQLADFASPLFRNAIMAHFAGDEKMPPDQRKLISQLAGYSTDLSNMVTSLWADLGTTDNKVPIRYSDQ